MVLLPLPLILTGAEGRQCLRRAGALEAIVDPQSKGYVAGQAWFLKLLILRQELIV